MLPFLAAVQAIICRARRCFVGQWHSRVLQHRAKRGTWSKPLSHRTESHLLLSIQSGLFITGFCMRLGIISFVPQSICLWLNPAPVCRFVSPVPELRSIDLISILFMSISAMESVGSLCVSSLPLAHALSRFISTEEKNYFEGEPACCIHTPGFCVKFTAASYCVSSRC